jgi:amino acid transporter
MYGAPVPAYPVRPARPPSAGTAETLVLIAFIFQAIAALLFLIPFGIFALLAAAASIFGGIAIIFAAIFIAFGALDILFLYIGYAYVYRNTKEGKYEEARSPALVLGILGIIFGFLITGILYLVAYSKLGDAVNESRQPFYGYPMQGYYPGTAPGFAAPQAPLAPGLAPGTPVPGAQPMTAPVGPACPRCGRPTVYVAQYSRYFCTTDQQYV